MCVYGAGGFVIRSMGLVRCKWVGGCGLEGILIMDVGLDRA